MGENSKCRTAKKVALLCVGFLILLFLQSFTQMGWGDDVWFTEDTRPLWKYLQDRYSDWTSRLLLETGIKLLTASPNWIWRMLNTLIVMLLIWIVADIFGLEKKQCKATGTNLNYLWPLTLGLVAMRPIKHWVKGEKCFVWEYPVCLLCMVFAANTEQGAAVLLGAHLLFGAYLLKKNKKLPPFYFLLLGLVAASVIFILTTPGNVNRLLQEMERFFPEYKYLNMSEKLLMGFLDTASYYLAAGGAGRRNFLFALFLGILLAAMWQKRAEKHFLPKVIIALLPFLFIWGIGILGKHCLLYGGFRRGGRIIGLLSLNRCLPSGGGAIGYFGWIPYSLGDVLLQAGVYLGLLVCVALTIYFLHGRSRETLFEFMILGAGLLSRLIIGFSPTIYASGERTTLFCSAAILIVCLRNLQLCWNKITTEWSKIVLKGYIVCVICISVFFTFLPALRVVYYSLIDQGVKTMK